jgi:hypothetical protein
MGKITNSCDVLFVSLLSRVRFTYPDWFFLFLQHKRLFVAFGITVIYVGTSLFCGQSFFALLTQLCCIFIPLQSNLHPSAVQCTTRHRRLCIVLVAQNYSRGFQLTLLRMQGVLLIIIVVIPARHTKNWQRHPPS